MTGSFDRIVKIAQRFVRYVVRRAAFEEILKTLLGLVPARLLEVDSALQLSRFMGYFNSKLAKEVGRLTNWRQKIFGRRYQAVLAHLWHRQQPQPRFLRQRSSGDDSHFDPSGTGRSRESR